MRISLFITLFLSSYIVFGQGLEPSQIQGAPKLNDILQAKNMYIDEYGDTLYIYQHTSLDGLTTTYDSIYVSNDSIRLKYGSGFVKIPKIKPGQTTTIQTLITDGDTIYAGVNTNSLDSTHIKVGSISLTDLAFTPLTNITGTSPISVSGSGNSRDISYTGMTGSGTVNKMPKWTTTTNLGDSDMWNDGVTTWIGTKQSLGKFEINKSWSGADQQNILASGNIPMIGLRNGQYQFNFGSGYVGNNVLSILGSGGVGESPVSQLINIENNGNTSFNGSEIIMSGNLRLTQGLSQITLGASSNPATVQAYFNLAGNQRFRIQNQSALSYIDFFTPATGSNRNFSFATSYFNNGDFNLLKSSTAGGNPTNRIWTANDNGFGIATDPLYTLDVGGSARIQNRSGSAVVGAGFDSNGKLVEYSLDTAITIPETIITAGTNISVTGNGSSNTPYVVSNTFTQAFQTISTNGAAGNITLSNSGGTLNLNVNDADASTTNEKINSISSTGNVLTITENGINYTANIDSDPTNEISKIGVSTSLTGGAKIMNYTQGFSNGVGTNLVISGATSSVSTSSDGGVVTWTLPDNSASNELQNLSWNPTTRALGISSGTGVTLSDWMLRYDGGATSNFNSVLNNGIWRWTGTTNGPNGTNHSTLFHAMSDANAYGWQLASTDAADDMYYRNNNGSTWSSWYRIASRAWASSTFLTSEVDGNVTNELNTSFVKSGNTITISDAGGARPINISQTVTPSNGQVLKWDGTQWNADTDNNTGLVYTGSTGINVSGTVITNTGDVSNTNEVDVVRVSSAVTGGGRIQNATNGSNQGSEIGLVINGATASVTTGINGQITWTLPTDQVGITSLNGLSGASQTLLYGIAGVYPSWSSSGTSHTFRLPTASSQQVLKFDGAGWTAGTDNNTTYSAGAGIFINGSNVITNTGILSEIDGLTNNEGLMTLTTNVASTNYTYASNTSGSTSLILNASTGITMPRSGNQISFALTNTGVTANTYTNATVTVDAQGRITSASNGSASGSKWTESGGSLYPNTLTNNVGIGTTPTSGVMLHVDKSYTSADQQNIRASGNVPIIGLRNGTHTF